ncbi:hypothetical protein [Pseudoalteromonas sp. APC 3691]|uniref:hypothetical protein n=1 Tax=Pseudoalteromonas sp. APC 3691 TaxID=3035173 RepID=UPI0025B3D0D5|nr:hypothetical protein [Pseudoalteromonas sp. APC 3691]MDN3389558.1 hypothetical protein [Pseudoalteromonas sp. APC 3691]
MKKIVITYLLVLLFTGCKFTPPPNINKYGKPYSPEIMKSPEQAQLIKAHKLRNLAGAYEEGDKIARKLQDEGYPQATYYFYTYYNYKDENHWGCRSGIYPDQQYTLSVNDKSRKVLKDRLYSLADGFCSLRYSEITGYPGNYFEFDEYLVLEKDPIVLAMKLSLNLKFINHHSALRMPIYPYIPPVGRITIDQREQILITDSVKKLYVEFIDAHIKYVQENPGANNWGGMLTNDLCRGDGIEFPIQCNKKEVEFLRVINKDFPYDSLLLSLPEILVYKGLSDNLAEIKLYLEKLKTLQKAGYRSSLLNSRLADLLYNIKQYEAI